MFKALVTTLILGALACHQPPNFAELHLSKASEAMERATDAEKEGHYRDAIAHLSEAVSEYRLLTTKTGETGDWSELVACLNRIGWNQTVYLGDYDGAAQHLAEAGAIAEAELPPEHRQRVRNLHNSAILAYYENRLEDALALNQKVLAIRESNPDLKRETAATLNNLGLVHRAKGELSQARRHYERSLRLKLEALGEMHSDLATSYQNLGYIHHVQGQYPEALDLLNKAYELRRRHLGANHPDVAAAGYALARAHLEVGEVALAKPILEKSLRIQAETLGEAHPHFAHTLWEMARVQAWEGDFDGALLGLEKAKVIFDDHFGEGNYHLAENQQHLAWFYWRKGEYTTALAYLDRAVAVFENRLPFGGDTALMDETIIRCLHGKATVLVSKYLAQNQAGDLKAALDTVVEAAGVMANAQRRILTEEARLNLARRSRRILDFGVDIAMTLHARYGSRQALELAFILAEQGKMSVLRQALGDLEILRVAGVPQDALQREAELRQRGYQLETQAAHQMKGEGVVADALQVALLDHGNDVAEFLDSLEANHPRYFELKYRPFVPELATFQNALPTSGSAMVSYHLGKEQITIFVLKPDSLVGTRVSVSDIGQGDSPALIAADWFTWPKENRPGGLREVARLRSSMVYGKRDVFCRYARWLYQRLIEPVAGEIEEDDLIIVPDGNLAFLPFEALLQADPSPGEDWNLAYLIKSHEISYVHAGGLLDQAPDNPWRWHQPKGIAFAPVFETGKAKADPKRGLEKLRDREIPVQPLPHTQTEVAALDRLYAASGGQLRVWTNSGANKKTFLEALASGQTIHLATHAIIDETYPSLSHLVFAESDADKLGNQLYLGEVFSLKLDAELVVLSACETGRGRIASGEGVLGFVRGFHYAGAKRILVSLWQVADESTSELMVAFYSDLFAGSEPRAALRSAKLDGISQGWPPYAWAGFVLTGRLH